MSESGPQPGEHVHEAITHSHPHFHVTHNYFERAGAFEHLGYQHEHSHDHAEVTHSHYPHQDFESEHRGEAHEHAHPAKRDVTTPAEEPDQEPAPTATAKKSAKKVPRWNLKLRRRQPRRLRQRRRP